MIYPKVFLILFWFHLEKCKIFNLFQLKSLSHYKKTIDRSSHQESPVIRGTSCRPSPPLTAKDVSVQVNSIDPGTTMTGGYVSPVSMTICRLLRVLSWGVVS